MTSFTANYFLCCFFRYSFSGFLWCSNCFFYKNFLLLFHCGCRFLHSSPGRFSGNARFLCHRFFLRFLHRGRDCFSFLGRCAGKYCHAKCRNFEFDGILSLIAFILLAGLSSRIYRSLSAIFFGVGVEDFFVFSEERNAYFLPACLSFS